MEMQNRLQVALLNINNEKIPLYEGVNTVGRNKDAVAIIKHMTVSQNHAVIVIINEQHYISDLNSSNGSFIEGSKITPFKLYQLRNETKVTLGELSGKYLSKGPFSEISSTKISLGTSDSFYGCSTQLLGKSLMHETDIHDAPTQEISWANIKQANKGRNIGYAHSPSVSLQYVTDLTDHFNDENLPCLENSEAFSNGKLNSQAQAENPNCDEQTEVFEDNKLPQATTLEDDETTDCEDNISTKLENKLTCQKGTTPLSILDKPEDKVINSPEQLREFDNDSSDSLEFLKSDKSVIPDNAVVEGKTLQCDSDTENFPTRRTRKSARVVSTQDFNDSCVSSDTDNCSKTKLRLTDCFEDSIPPTQNQFELELDESDFIPATQEVNKADKNGSSEESFKLGLTELMTDSSQDIHKSHKIAEINNKDETLMSKSNQDNLDIFSAPTQKVFTGEKKGMALNVKRITSDDTFLAPTQKASTGEKGADTLNLKTTTSDDLFLAPTQKLTYRNPSLVMTSNTPHTKLCNSFQEDTDLYDAPTQKVCNDVANVPLVVGMELDVQKRQILKSVQGICETDIYDAPTQKVFIGVENASRAVDLEVNEVQQTEGKLEMNINCPKENQESKFRNDFEQESMEFYECPTQKVFVGQLDVEVDSIHNSNTTSKRKISEEVTLNDSPQEKDNLPRNEVDVYGEVQESTEIYDAPTQKIGNNFDTCNVQASEQGIPVIHNFGTPDELSHLDLDLNSKSKMKDKKGHRKVFSFKKKTCNLNASLSGLAADKSIRIHRTNELSSSGPNNIVHTNNLTTHTIESDKIVNNIASTNSELVDRSDSLIDEKPASVISIQTVVDSEVHMKGSKSVNDDILSNAEESNLSTKYNKLDDTVGNTLNSTNFEVNKSVAVLESKRVKTKKSGKAADIRITVPRSRRSMSISKTEEISNPSKSEVKDTLKSVSKKIVPEQESSSSISLKVAKRTRSTTKPAKISELKTRKTSSRISKITDRISFPADIAEENPSTSINPCSSSRGRPTISHSKLETKNSSRTKSRSYSINNNIIESVQYTGANKTAPLIEEVQSDTKACNKTKTSSKRKKPPLENDADVVPIDKDVTPTKMQKLHLSDEVHNSFQRGLRKQRPKVVFTMMENPHLESLIKQLGGSVVDSVESCTVLVTERVKRSQKLLSAIGLGKPICSPKWITDSKKAHEFLNPWDYILVDPEAEAKWNFSLRKSLDRSKQQKLLHSQSFVIQTTNAADVLKGAIESCGGKCLSKVPATSQEDVYIVSSSDNRGKYSKIIKKHSSVKVIEAEAIFDGVLRQEMRVSKHILK